MSNTISVIQNVKTTFSNPFPHVTVDDALPDSIYNELEATFPAELVCSTHPHDGGITFIVLLILISILIPVHHIRMVFLTLLHVFLV